MCGHATIAGVHALVETGRFPGSRSNVVVGGAGQADASRMGRVYGSPTADGSVQAGGGTSEVGGEETGETLKIQTLGGVLTAFVESAPGGGSRMIWLELICPTLGDPAITGADLAGPLGLGAADFDPSLPTVSTQDGDLLAFVDSVVTLHRAAPDFRRLGAVLDAAGVRGLCLATVKTLAPSIGVHSRFFAPSYGVDEDPVTGSVHGPLAAYLVDQGKFPIHEGTAGMMCVQGKPGGRSGVVFVLVERGDDGGRSVRIGGQAVTTMRGMISGDGP